ncbi:MAG: MIP/aquaporin family protein [Saprospiraceae bacterium]
MNKYIVEFIGTFFFVLTIVCVVNGDASGGIIPPLAIGSALMIMVYAGGHISGGHYNPAVTLAATIRGAAKASEAPAYIIAQVAGGALAAILGMTLLGKAPEIAATAMPSNMGGAIAAEFLGTFALAWVVLQTATTKATTGNSYYGLAIGFTVVVMAYALGSYAGGFFNPAIAISAAINGLASWGTAGLGLAADFAGAAAAAFAFKAVYSGE